MPTKGKFSRPKRNCVVCNKLFQPERDKRKCCTKKCAYEYLSQTQANNMKKGKKRIYYFGEKSSHWKGGCVNAYGYIVMAIKKKNYFGHRLAMENYLGRKLTKNEIVHHINENKSDNRIENLQVMTRSEHMSLHKKLKKNKVLA